MEGGTVIRMRKERKYRPLVGPKKKRKGKGEQVDGSFIIFFVLIPGENKLGNDENDDRS